MARDLYSAAVGAGKAAGAYKSSLYSTADIEDKMSFIGRKSKLEQEQLSEKFQRIGAGLELTSTLYGGWQDAQERKETMGDIQTKMVEQEFRDPKGEIGKDFANFEEFQKSDMFTEARDKYAPKQTTSFLDRVMGKEKKYQFGESPYELSKTDISLWGKFSKASKMDKFFGDKYSSWLDNPVYKAEVET
jgi:hypothetical protein